MSPAAEPESRWYDKGRTLGNNPPTVYSYLLGYKSFHRIVYSTSFQYLGGPNCT